MRGRAIRKDANNPDKISNIWHLASVSVPKKSDIIGDIISEDEIEFPDIENTEGMYDLSRLAKRFDGYEAPSYYDNHEITSGIDRVISSDFISKVYLLGEKAFADLNKLSVSLACNRQQTKKWWDDAIFSGYNKSVMSIQTGVESPCLTTKTLVYSGYRQEFISLGLTFIAILYILFCCGLFYPLVLLLWFAAFLFGIGYVLIKFIKTGSAASVMKQIAVVHLETLWQMDLINTSLRKVGIKVTNGESVFLSCRNLPTEENNLLIKALQEFLDPIDNPRYLLIRKGKGIGGARQTDYFSIPAVISTNKKNVKLFKKLWNKYIGDCEIVYTRNAEGRKLLLKARTTAFSASKRDKTKKVSKWQ
jgi:hypothetical protein